MSDVLLAIEAALAEGATRMWRALWQLGAHRGRRITQVVVPLQLVGRIDELLKEEDLATFQRFKWREVFDQGTL